MTVKRYTKNSSLRSLLRSPLGKDIVMRVLMQFNKSRALIDNPIAAMIKLKNLPALSKGQVTESDVENMVNLLNLSLNEQYVPRNTPETKHWWKETAVYQIYPRSFMDSDGDGIGDIKGIIRKLDYIKNLGVGAIWLSPIYDSPNDDNGYDIRDYRKIMKEFGNMKDFDLLLEEIHKREMRLIMDLVINHTSDEHEWFKKARQGAEKYQDYYIRRTTADKKPPNNWRSLFSGSAWNYYEDTDDWYLHLFSKKQMDLNWDNPSLREEIYKMVNFWLDKGVDGFRLDVISFISKSDGLPDGMELFNKFGVAGVEHYFAGPRLHEYLRELNEKTFSKYDVFTVGETPVLGLEAIKLATAENRRELNTAFSFDHLDCPGHMRWDDYDYDLRHLKKIFDRNQKELSGGVWNTLFFENHDNPRMPSKIDRSGKFRFEIAKLLGLLQCTQKGTPFIYQGQELGMVNADFADISEFRDIESINMYNEKIAAGQSEKEALSALRIGSRDHARTPVQWTADGGFTTGKPWIKMSADCAFCNAKSQTVDPDSVYSFYRKILTLRGNTPALIYGNYRLIKTGAKKYNYIREYDGEKYMIEINLTAKPLHKTRAQAILSSYPTPSRLLRPYEAVIYRLK